MQYYFWYTKQSNNVGKKKIRTLRCAECSLTLKIGDQTHKPGELINISINSIITLTTWYSRNEIYRPNFKVLLQNWHREKQTWLLRRMILSFLVNYTTTYEFFHCFLQSQPPKLRIQSLNFLGYLDDLPNVIYTIQQVKSRISLLHEG